MMSAGSLTTPWRSQYQRYWRFELQRCHSINTRAKRLEAMIARLRKYTPQGSPKRTGSHHLPISSARRWRAESGTNRSKHVETASTKLSKGAFQGRNQSCHAKETSNTQSIKASWMPGTSGAHTTGKQNPDARCATKQVQTR